MLGKHRSGYVAVDSERVGYDGVRPPRICIAATDI